jgi:hypothetical protein
VVELGEPPVDQPKLALLVVDLRLFCFWHARVSRQAPPGQRSRSSLSACCAWRVAAGRSPVRGGAP